MNAGPLTVFDGNQMKLIGVVSFGVGNYLYWLCTFDKLYEKYLHIFIIKGCGKPGYPGVYAKVAKVMSWILQIADLPGKVSEACEIMR